MLKIKKIFLVNKHYILILRGITSETGFVELQLQVEFQMADICTAEQYQLRWYSPMNCNIFL